MNILFEHLSFRRIAVEEGKFMSCRQIFLKILCESLIIQLLLIKSPFFFLKLPLKFI
jgi:hypothetical protein